MYKRIDLIADRQEDCRQAGTDRQAGRHRHAEEHIIRGSVHPRGLRKGFAQQNMQGCHRKLELLGQRKRNSCQDCRMQGCHRNLELVGGCRHPATRAWQHPLEDWLPLCRKGGALTRAWLDDGLVVADCRRKGGAPSRA